MEAVKQFEKALNEFSDSLKVALEDENGEWVMKALIDVHENLYTLTTDTKLISKMLEMNLLAMFQVFGHSIGYRVELASQQNWYPDISFVNIADESLKFAVDIKTSFRRENKSNSISGFTLGSHGSYFKERDKSKNIQYPYNAYNKHYCLGVVYSRIDNYISKQKPISKLKEITSVLKDFDFFAVEKWKIASDVQGSGNTANIGSVKRINDLKNENGVFSQLGEDWFDEYWINYGVATMIKDGVVTPITNIWDFLEFKGRTDLINKVQSKRKRKLDK